MFCHYIMVVVCGASLACFTLNPKASAWLGQGEVNRRAKNSSLSCGREDWHNPLHQTICIYTYIFESCLSFVWVGILQKKAWSKQNKGHLSSRLDIHIYIHIYIYIFFFLGGDALPLSVNNRITSFLVGQCFLTWGVDPKNLCCIW